MWLVWSEAMQPRCKNNLFIDESFHLKFNPVKTSDCGIYSKVQLLSRSTDWLALEISHKKLILRTVLRYGTRWNDSISLIFLAEWGEGVSKRRKHQGCVSKTSQVLSILLLLCHIHDCKCNIRIRVSEYLILPCLWLKAIINIIIIITNIYIFCIFYFPNGNLWSCPSFAASPFDKLLGHCAYNRSQLMLLCVSLHAYLAFLRLTVGAEVAS